MCKYGIRLEFHREIDLMTKVWKKILKEFFGEKNYEVRLGQWMWLLKTSISSPQINGLVPHLYIVLYSK